MSDTEAPAPEVQEQQEDQPASPETSQEKVESQEQVEETPKQPEAESEPEAAQEPEASSEEQPEPAAGDEPEGDKNEEDAEKPTEAVEAGEEEQVEQVEEVKEPEPELEVEEPVVITPEGNPLWLSTEEVLSKGLPESEVEHFKNFYFKRGHSLKTWYEALKDFAVQTEYITLSKEEMEVLTSEGDVADEQLQVLNGLQDRVNSAIELYEKDGAIVKINDRSAKDSFLERSEESFIQTVRDSVINSLEVEKQSICAYSVWKDQEHHPGAFKRGMQKLRNSFRRSRTGSAGGRSRRTKLEEEKDSGPKEGEGEEPKPAEEGASAPTQEGGEEEASNEVTIQIQLEETDDAPVAAPAEVEEPKEEAAATEAPTEEEPKEEAVAEAPTEEPKEEAAAEVPPEEPKEEPKVAEAPTEQVEEAPKEEEGEKKEDGEIQAAETEEEEEVKSKPDSKPSRRKQKTADEQQHRAAKAEPLDNRVLRAFGRVTGTLCRVENGKAALEQLRSSARIRSDLNKLKAFGGVEGVQISLSVSRWQTLPDHAGMVFRGFVYDNELNGLSQYNDTTYFPNVVHYKDTVITGKIQQFFQDNIKETLKELNNYIIDFFVAPDKVYVIRLNPFYTAVGACLFTWTEHGHVLTKGPLEFRIVDTPKTAPEAFSSYQPYWQEMLTSVLNQRKTESRATTSKCVIL